jgi:hypothetical protein
MEEVVSAVRHTPIWVFPLFLAVLWLGALHLRERSLSIWTMAILPVVMVGLAVANLAVGSAFLGLAVPAFLFSLAIGAAIGWSLAKRPVAIDREKGSLRLSGSVTPFLVVIGILALRYVTGYLYGRWPELRANPALALEISATGALLAGIVLGRLAHLVRWYREA